MTICRPAAQAEFLADHDPLDRSQGVLVRLANDHPLARGETIRLHDHGILARFYVLAGRLG